MIGRAIWWLAVIAVVFIPSASQAPPQPIVALAPFETLLDGRRELVGIVVRDDGTVYVSDRDEGVVYRVVANGQSAAFVTGLDRPAGLALDADDRLLVAEEGSGRVLRRETSGALAVLATGIKTPRWLAVASDGGIYVSAHRLAPPDGADESEGREILRLGTDGTVSAVATGIRHLEGLAVVGDRLVAATKALHSDPASTGGLLRYPILAGGGLDAPQRWTAARLKKSVGVVGD